MYINRLLDSDLAHVVARAKWKSNGSADACRNVAEMDALLERMEDIFLERRQTVVQTAMPLITEYRMKWAESYWMSIIDKFKIKPDLRLYRECVKRAKSNALNPRRDFLDTYTIDEKHPFHNVLLGRQIETMTYGLLKTVEWYNFFCFLTNGSCAELKFIAGLVYKSGGSPFKVKRGDNSIIEDTKLFYNIQNIVECCLNICDLRFSLNFPVVELYTSRDQTMRLEIIRLDDILDEIALRIPVSPKIICSEIKKYLTFAIRVGGAYAVRQATFDHGGVTHADRKTTNTFTKIEFDGSSFFEPFMKTQSMMETEREGRDVLKKYGLIKLERMIDTYLHTSLIKTSCDHFTAISSFLHRLMSVSGYGRALNYSSSPRSAEPLVKDELGLAEEIKNIILSLDRQAIEKGFLPPTGGRWIPTCIASWKSTSAGVKGLKANIIVNGKSKRVRISKKTAVGAFLGPKAFTRKYLQIKNSKEQPGGVGFRDVPYKPTRAIYVIPISNLCAQIAVISHIVDFASTKGKNSGLISKDIDPSHFTTGSNATSGIRVFDNMDTIKASGSIDTLALGTDLSSFDAHCISWNFRKPMLSALAHAGAGRVYGPENITQQEMLHYAFGKGIIEESYWDNGREPIIYIKEEDMPFFDGLGRYIHETEIHESSTLYRILPGAKSIPKGRIKIFDIDNAIKDGVQFQSEKLSIGVRMDGADLVYLTSEASGEKSTLTMNTIANLAMQRKALLALKRTTFGSIFTPMFQKGVGDDAEWIGRLGRVSDPSIIQDAVNVLEETYAKMGHIFSPSKTFILPMSAEFVQTFARFGLYLPRDQIPVIASEKPRDIRNPVAFLNSFKSILLAKQARGMNSDYAFMLYYIHFRKITELSLKRHKLTIMSPEFIYLAVPLIEDVFIKVANLQCERESERITNIRENVIIFRYSTSVCYIPVTSGGGGLNPILMGIIHSPAFFYQFISYYPRDFQKMMIATYHFMTNRELNDGSETGNRSGRNCDRIKLGDDFTPFSPQQLFSRGVMDNLEHTKTLNIGRLDAHNVPRTIMMNGLQMEKFMHVETNFIREEYAERFVLHMKDKLHRIAPKHDEWILNFKFILDENSNVPDSHSFWNGLCAEYSFLIRTCKIATQVNRISGTSDRMRAIISRDPVLRSIRTPDEIISILDKYGVVTPADREVGLVILLRMGFESSVANSLLDLRFSAQDDAIQEKTYGMFADDFLSSLNIMTRERLESVSFPNGFDHLAKKLLFAFGSQYQLFTTFFFGKNYILSEIKDIITDSDPNSIRKFTLFPRTLRKLLQTRRNKIGILSSFVNDLNAAPGVVDHNIITPKATT
uniref:RNA-directed RNA polymerase n=1 Tax=Morris orbivirus TaxID=1963252 RepID=A0A1S6PCZ9_9REOV|nr:VP1 [Morris orbivirus]